MKNSSFLSKLKTFFLIPEILKLKEVLDYKGGRISRETFVILNVVSMLLFSIIFQFLSSTLFILFFPKIVIEALNLAVFGVMAYVMIVLWKKRFHDLNRKGWLSIFAMGSSGLSPLNNIAQFTWPYILWNVVLPSLHIIFLIYLCLKKGNPERNKYGVSADYKKPSSFFLFCCYCVLVLWIISFATD